MDGSRSSKDVIRMGLNLSLHTHIPVSPSQSPDFLCVGFSLRQSGLVWSYRWPPTAPGPHPASSATLAVKHPPPPSHPVMNSSRVNPRADTHWPGLGHVPIPRARGMRSAPLGGKLRRGGFPKEN